MLNETNDLPILRQWKKFVKQQCPRCYKHSFYQFIKTSGLKLATRRGHAGTAHLAQYKCQTDDCSQVVELEVFVPFSMQTIHMFDAQNSDD